MALPMGSDQRSDIDRDGSSRRCRNVLLCDDVRGPPYDLRDVRLAENCVSACPRIPPSKNVASGGRRGTHTAGYIQRSSGRTESYRNDRWRERDGDRPRSHRPAGSGDCRDPTRFGNSGYGVFLGPKASPSHPEVFPTASAAATTMNNVFVLASSD